MHQFKKGSGLVTGVLLPVGLICVFAFCSLLMAVMGARAYRSLQTNNDDSYGSTVAANYLRTKLAQNNAAGRIELRDEGGVQVLVIREEGEELNYETRIFVHGGNLREIYVSENQLFVAQSGTVIAPLQSCIFSIDDEGLFEAEITSPRGIVTNTAFSLVEDAHVGATGGEEGGT